MGQDSSGAQGKYAQPSQPQGKYNQAPDVIIRNNQTGQGPEAPLPVQTPGMPTGNNEGGAAEQIPAQDTQGMAPYPGSPGGGKYNQPQQPLTGSPGGSSQGKYTPAQQPQGKYAQPQQPSVSPQVTPPSSSYGQAAGQAYGTGSQTKDQLPPELQQAIANGGDEANFTQMGYIKNQQGQWVKG